MEVNRMAGMFMRIISVRNFSVDMQVSFNSLVALTCEQLELDESVELFVLLDFGKSNVQTVVPIKKDNDVAWYLAFAKDATSRHPLVAHNNFQFRTIVSNLKFVEFRCLQEGCKWYVRASRYKKSDLWMLRKYTSDHDCSLSIAQSSHMQAFSTVIGNCLIDDFGFMSTDRSIPKEIVHKARTNLEVNISYQIAWRVKEHMVKILDGNTVESYALIPRFFDKLVESNSSTWTALEMDDSGHFKFCFIAFDASIEG
ncbi:hypothetical protein IC582_028756 [Cucumis melo]